MPYIAEPSHTTPHGQVREHGSAQPIAECPNMELAWIVAEALNLREDSKQDAEVKWLDDLRMEEE